VVVADAMEERAEAEVLVRLEVVGVRDCHCSPHPPVATGGELTSVLGVA
jgi:hydroxylamine reductase (hybrid-cluster protein)